jgi:uncharacterized protein (TIGR02246 family)
MSGDRHPVRCLTPGDLLEIRELFARWSHTEDTGQAEAWAEIFTSDGTHVNSSGRQATGREALAENSRQRWAKPASHLAIHWLGDPVVEATGEGALARQYGMLIDLTSGGCRMRGLTQRSYRLRREGGSWRVYDMAHITGES